MRKTPYLMLLITLVMWGCSQTEEESNREDKIEASESAYETLKKEVMSIHDAVMPESSTIIEYTKTLRESADTLSAKAAEKSQALIKELKQADRAMMEWMRQYDDPEKLGLKLDSAIIYMEEQKEKIKEVDSLMRTSLRNAKQYFEEME